MPEPVKTGQRYMPGLDGLRAVAVLGVLAYHLGADWIPGGLLGVGVFFTLSGYLITDLLLAQVQRRGRIDLPGFWLARARRLLPALVVLLIVVMAWVTVIGPHQPSDFRQSAGSALFYFQNWWLIFHDVSYFTQFASPEPLNHLWSLSVEEQFYIFWPFLLLIGLKLVPEVRAGSQIRPRLALVTLGAALVSVVLMAVLYRSNLDPSRVYYGTDTRAQELLIGAALAMVWPSRMLRAGIPGGARRLIDGGGAVGLLVIALMFWRCGEFSPFLYRGGFLLLSIATALVVAASAHPAARLGPILGMPAHALDRRALLRHLPLALPDHRSHHPGRRPRPGPRAGAPPARRHPRDRRALVEVRREPDPPWSAGAPARPAAGEPRRRGGDGPLRVDRRRRAGRRRGGRRRQGRLGGSPAT